MLLTAVLAAGCGGSSASPTTSATPAAQAIPSAAVAGIGQGLKGPAGLEATLYATGLRNVSAFAIDTEGHLWAATSAASDHSRDAVYVITNAGAKPVKVISGVRGPLGLAWYAGSLYVASLGRVDAYSQLVDRHFRLKQTVIVQPKGHGWNNAIVALPSGRLALGISSACDHCVSRSRWSGTIVSFRPDGGDVQVYASGIRAPFGMAYDVVSGALVTSMNQRDDLGAMTPGDWLALVSEGQNWRFPGCYGQGGSACSGAPKPLAVLDRHAAAGAVALVSGDLAGGGNARAAVVSEWKRGVVLRVPLPASTSGSASSQATTFLSGFRNPLPLALALDRSLLVGDWGTGKIYRIAAV